LISRRNSEPIASEGESLGDQTPPSFLVTAFTF
jgi:hypothetical protein